MPAFRLRFPFYAQRVCMLPSNSSAQNIFLTEEGILKIGDLGMVREEGSAEDGHEGDHVYMARELLDTNAKTPSADIFSFGVLHCSFVPGRRVRGGRFFAHVGFSMRQEHVMLGAVRIVVRMG